MPELITVAVDGTPAGDSALALAGRQASKTGARVVVLCTIDPAYALGLLDGQISLADQTDYPAAANEERAAQRIVGEALTHLRALGIDAEAEILSGTPAQAILCAAKRLQASMIVMGHRHLSWPNRALHPSVCWDVLEHASCPVLVSKAEN